MKNKRIKKYLSLGITGTLATASLISATSLIQNTNNSDVKQSQVFSTSNQASSKALSGAWQANNNDVTTTANHIINFSELTSTYSLDVPSQYYASDASNSSFATFTSSTANGSFDQITRFITNPQKKVEGTTDNSLIYPGDVAWIVKKSDLATILGVNDSDLVLKGMIFSDGGFGSYPSLFVLANSSSSTANSSGSYVFRIMWNAASTAIGSDPIPAPGAYKLAQKVSNSTTDFYDLLSLESPSTSTIQVLKTPAIVSPASILTFNYKTISDASFANPTNDGALQTITYTIDATLASNSFGNNMKVKHSFRLNSDMYVLYQSTTAQTVNASRYAVLIKFPLLRDATSMALTANNLAILDLTSQFNDGTFSQSTTNPLAINLTNVSSSNYFLTISSANGTGSSTGISKYVQVSFDLNTMFTATTKYSLKTFSLTGTNIYFRNIQKLYGGVNDATVIGYLAIDNANRAIKLNTDFTFNKFLYDFNKASLSLGNIFFVYTKPGDSSWYALMADTKFVQFSDSTLIGRWDVLSSSATLELPINYTIKSQDQISNSVLYQKVANDTNDNYDVNFTTYLAGTLAFQDFIDVTFVDPRLGAVNPSVSVSASTFTNSADRKYSVTLTFKQNLRSLNADGSISTSGTTSEVTLFTKTYTFINAVGNITPANDETSPFEVPAFIKAKLPSEITTDEIAKYLFKIENIGSYQISAIPNDLKGTLVVTMNVSFMWSQIAGTYVLETSKLSSYTFGSDSTPFFANNPLFGRDTSITPIDDAYVATRPELLASLSTKYSATLPSAVLGTQVINDFVILGNAFQDQSSIDNGTIIPPTADDITLIPFDREGYLLIRILFPKIGNLVNHEVLFSTPKVFLVNPTAQEIVYFAFKTNQQALDTDVTTTQKVKDFTPLEIANQLNNITDPEYLITVLRYFAIFSDYFSKLALQAADGSNAINIEAIPNNAAGTLEIKINLLNALPNSNITNFTKVFSGLKTDGTITGLTASTFSFNTMSSELLKLTPSQITSNMLESNNVFNMNDSAKALGKEITLNPINTSGALEVTVTFYNWVENSTTIVPTKQFSRTFTGFVVSRPQVDSFVWKSFAEIDPQYQSLLPSSVVSTVTNSLNSNSARLLVFANLSNSLLNYVQANESKLTLSYVTDDVNGNLSVIARINGYSSTSSVNAFETVLSGFNFTNRNFAITLESNDSFRLQALKQKIPSQITENEIASLYTIPSTSNLNKKISVEQDDKQGTLKLNIELINPYTNEVVASSSQLYTGFVQFVPQPQSVDVLTIAISILIPLVVLLIPIIFLGVFKNRRLVKATARKLDKRLRDIEKGRTK